MNKPECNGCDCQDACAESMRNPSILFTSPRCKHKKSFYVCLEMSEKSMAERIITLIGDSGAGKLPLIFHRDYDTVIAPINTRNESMNNELGKIWCEIVELAKKHPDLVEIACTDNPPDYVDHSIDLLRDNRESRRGNIKDNSVRRPKRHKMP